MHTLRLKESHKLRILLSYIIISKLFGCKIQNHICTYAYDNFAYILLAFLTTLQQQQRKDKKSLLAAILLTIVALMLETIALQTEHCTVSDTKLESLIKSERTIVSIVNKNAIATK